MLEHQHRFRLQRMAELFGVSRSGYYEWRRTGQELTPKARRQAILDKKISAAFLLSKQRDGARRIRAALAEQGQSVDLKTVFNSMKRQGLRAKAARKFKVTTDSNHQHPVAPNLLEQQFQSDAPNQKWVGDITYLQTIEGWLYLAVVIDLYSRAVVGWSMSSRMTAELTCDALNMAVLRRGKPKGVITHSDRGSQYCSTSYRELIAKHQLTQSMSRKGNCWDNAVAESFFHTLKVELLKDEPLTDRNTLKQQVFEYIEVDYNKTRRHSSNGYLSPENYEMKNIA